MGLALYQCMKNEKTKAQLLAYKIKQAITIQIAHGVSRTWMMGDNVDFLKGIPCYSKPAPRTTPTEHELSKRL